MLGKVPEAFRSEYDLTFSQGMSTASVTANPSYDLLIHSVEGLEEIPRQGQLILVNDVGDDFTEVTNELSL